MRTTRRAFLGGSAATVSAAVLGAPALAQAKARVVVLGGGFAGATCARELHRAEPGLVVTLVEENPIYTACPFSNSIIAGLRDIAAQRFGYEAIGAEGISVAQDRARAVDPQRRLVSLSSGAALGYDRLVLAPGLTFAGALCLATTRPRRRWCRTLGRRTSRPCCSGASSRRWRMAEPS